MKILITPLDRLQRLLGLIAVGISPWATALDLPAVDCVITPRVSIDLSSPLPGVLSEVSVERSDRVARDQVVARLESSVEKATVILAKERAKLDTEVRLGQVNRDYDHRQQRRMREISSSMEKVIAEADLDDAERRLALSRWKLQQAKDLRKLRSLELRKAEAQLQQKLIRSPIDGVVVTRFKQPGEYVEDQAILRIVQLDTLAIEAIVPMALFGHVKKGMQADIYPETSHDQPKRAKVEIVDQMGDASSGTFGVRLVLENSDMAVPAGVKCSAQFLPDLPLQQEESVAAQAIQDSQQRPLPRNVFSTQDETVAESASSLENSGRDNATAPLIPAALGTGERITEQCLSIGPIKSKDEAEALAHEIHIQGLDSSLRMAQKTEGNGFIVLTKATRSIDEAKALLDQMRKAGLKDSLLFRRGDYRNRISIGVFTETKRAESRRQQAENLGFQVQLEKRTRRSTRWWLDIKPSRLIDNFEPFVADIGQEKNLVPRPCVDGIHL